MIEYNRDMTQIHKRLDRDEQRALWVKIQEGDDDARNEVIYSCLPMVVDIAKRFRVNNRHVDLEDMVQEGNIALMCAVEKWDVERASITTVATWYIRNALIDMIHDAKYKIKNPLSMSRRASEELSKIKRCDTNNVKDILQKTNLKEKRINKLLSVDAKQRLSPEDIGEVLTCEDYEEETRKPCLADLAVLAEATLKSSEKEIFLRWSGLKGKKQGVKKIGEDLNLTRKEIMCHLSSAKRTLRNKAKEVQFYA
tara:strand:- start:288 stop:1046 length:759 start_codon:yes stop_codon:yes gene_type:complete